MLMPDFTRRGGECETRETEKNIKSEITGDLPSLPGAPIQFIRCSLLYFLTSLIIHKRRINRVLNHAFTCK